MLTIQFISKEGALVFFGIIKITSTNGITDNYNFTFFTIGHFFSVIQNLYNCTWLCFSHGQRIICLIHFRGNKNLCYRHRTFRRTISIIDLRIRESFLQ